MKQEITPDWQDWIKLNISRGCDKDGIARILFEHGFHPAAIVSAMQYLPQNAELIALMNSKLIAEHPAQAQSEQATFRAIDELTLPFAKRLKSAKAHLYLLDNFLSDAECDELIRRIRANNRLSTTTRSDEPDKYFRTSKTSSLSVDADAFIEELDLRIAGYMGFEPERAEGIQGQFYEVGQEFKAHTDYFEPDSDEYRKFAGARGQRTWTFMIYLNAVEEGGQTEFTRLGLAVTPKRGMAVIWNSLRPDGSVNPDTLHWARPVTKGEKFIITKWFRTHGTLAQPFKAAAWRKLPVFTREGFRKGVIPAPLMQAIGEFHAAQRPASTPEESDAIGTFIRSKDAAAPARMIELAPELRARISTDMQPLLEAWVGKPLQMTAVYGIREYQRGAVLDMHIDRKESHIVSAILNIAQDVNTDWPLAIQDHFGRQHDVLLKPGELLLYESARLKHGRPQALDGAYYANVFVHAMPA